MEQRTAVNSTAGKKAQTEQQYIVTGAYGFVGREICAQLAAGGCFVRGLVHRQKNVPMPAGCELAAGDLLVPASLEPLFAGLDPSRTVVIHTAAVISVKKKDAACERVNLQGTKNLLTACREKGIRCFVHFSSVDALHAPLVRARCVKGKGGKKTEADCLREPDCFYPEKLSTAYERSKAASAQCALREPGLACAVLLPSAIAGPEDYCFGFITKMLELFMGPFRFFTLSGGYDFVDVRDVAAAAITAARQQSEGCYILANRYISFGEVFALLDEHCKRRFPRLPLPGWLLYLFAPLLSVFALLSRTPPLVTPSALRIMRSHVSYNHEKAARELSFTPRPLSETFLDTIAFIKDERGKAKGERTAQKGTK